MTCQIPHCRKETEIYYLGKELCQDHWEKYNDDELKQMLKIKPKIGQLTLEGEMI
jgi:hypothetical protein